MQHRYEERRLYVADILDAIAQIQKYALAGRERLDKEELVRTWVVYHIQVIGEAAQRLSPELRDAHPEVPWAQIAAMRNILVHAYFRIDLEEVWSVVSRDLPVLQPQIKAILDELHPEEPCEGGSGKR